jgi:hypothetical protein
VNPLSALLACRKELIGIILVKELILVDKETSTRVGELKMRSAPQLRADTRLYDMLRLFATGRCHMAVLVQPPAQSTPRPETGVFAVACFGSVCPGQTTHPVSAICLSCCLVWLCFLFWRLAAARAIHPAARHGCVHRCFFWLHCLFWHCCLFWQIVCLAVQPVLAVLPLLAQGPVVPFFACRRASLASGRAVQFGPVSDRGSLSP